MKKYKKTVADDLRAAAAYMREHGKATRTAEADDGSVCAIGAIAHGLDAPIEICYEDVEGVSADYYRRYNHAVVILRNYLFAAGLAKGYSVAQWSDSSQADDVVTGMEKAAAWIEEQA